MTPPAPDALSASTPRFRGAGGGPARTVTSARPEEGGRCPASCAATDEPARLSVRGAKSDSETAPGVRGAPVAAGKVAAEHSQGEWTVTAASGMGLLEGVCPAPLCACVCVCVYMPGPPGPPVSVR